jgi:hypothetical protein
MIICLGLGRRSYSFNRGAAEQERLQISQIPFPELIADVSRVVGSVSALHPVAELVGGEILTADRDIGRDALDHVFTRRGAEVFRGAQPAAFLQTELLRLDVNKVQYLFSRISDSVALEMILRASHKRSHKEAHPYNQRDTKLASLR